MKECLIILGLYFGSVGSVVSLDFAATCTYYPGHSFNDVGRVVAMGYR